VKNQNQLQFEPTMKWQVTGLYPKLLKLVKQNNNQRGVICCAKLMKLSE
jgi:hypothetical protein